LADDNHENAKDFFHRITQTATAIKTHIDAHEFIRVISHLDADGLAAASILGKMLQRAEAFFRIRIVKQLSEDMLNELTSEEPSLLIFTDLGSGSLDLLDAKCKECDLIILDHHKPMDISFPHLIQVNPHLANYDGAQEISGAGVAYLTAKTMDNINIDLAPLAIVGALGDSQDKNDEKRLIGLNETIVEDAVNAGSIMVTKDLLFFGRETRPIHKALAFTTDPYIPGLSNAEDHCLGFLNNLEIDLKFRDRWRTINDLSVEEKEKIFSQIATYLSSKGSPDSDALKLIGTVYTLTHENRFQPLRDAREYASFLNACGRMRKGGLGVAVGMGSRRETLDQALEILTMYKKTLSQYLDWVIQTPNIVRRLENIYVINGFDVIDELLIGTIAGIFSSSYLKEKVPIIALTSTEEGMIKISGRIPHAFNRGDIDLGTIFHQVSTKLNGRGGGHNVAAGALIPKGTENQFIKSINAIIDSTLPSINPN
jgi:single-stranded-DNA-specific exonuclease